jgi:hypothetical protein
MNALRSSRLTTLIAALLLGFVAGCDDDPSGPTASPAEEVALVVNSVDISLTVFPVDSPTATTTVGLGADGSPVSVAARAGMAVVPLGIVPAAAIVDIAAGQVARTAALPEGSGATGVAFVDDSIAVVANPNLDTVTPVNVRTGATLAGIPVGGYPHRAVAVNDTVYVVNAELGPDFQPAGPGTVTVLTGSPPTVIATIPLSGTNPGAAAVGDGRVYVINSGRFGLDEGSLSVIDRGSLTEVAHHTGFGSFPGSIAADGDGRVFVGSFGAGLMVWDADAAAFTRGPDNAVAPDGVPSIAGVAADSDGRPYTLEPDCQAPARAFRLTDAFGVDATIAVGICPFAMAFTSLETEGP